MPGEPGPESKMVIGAVAALVILSAAIAIYSALLD